MISMLKTNVWVSISIIIFIYLIIYLIVTAVFYFVLKKKFSEFYFFNSLKLEKEYRKSVLVERILIVSVFLISSIVLLLGIKNVNSSVAVEDDISNNEILTDEVVNSQMSINDVITNNDYSERYQTSQSHYDVKVSSNDANVSSNDANVSSDDAEVSQNDKETELSEESENEKVKEKKEDKSKNNKDAAKKDKEVNKQQEKPAHVHSYTASITQQPSCLTDGVRTYKCSCGDSYTEKIPCNGHSWVDFEEVQHHDAVTHTEHHETTEQRTIHICLDCGYSTSGDIGKHLGATGHSGYYDETETSTTGSEDVVVVDSDAWDEVIHRRKCSVCGTIE